jgi:hypothetical protein
VIFIAAKFQVLPEHADAWPEIAGEFKKAQQTLPPHLAETPRIVNFTIPQDDWSELGELAVACG